MDRATLLQADREKGLMEVLVAVQVTEVWEGIVQIYMRAEAHMGMCTHQQRSEVVEVMARCQVVRVAVLFN
jgi:hypothetical protein